MFIQRKIGIIVIIFVSFILGGLAFSAYQAGAFSLGNGGDHHKYGFFKGAIGGFHGIDKDSPEWQEKKEAWEAKVDALRASGSKTGEFRKHGFGFGHSFGFKRFSDEVNHEVINLDNGIQITITSDNPDIVQKLQDAGTKLNSK